MIISFNRYNGGGGSGSGVTPEQVQQQIDSALTPYWESAITESAITEAVSGLATEQYVQDALSGVSLEGYWNSAQTEDAISAATAGKADAANITGGFQPVPAVGHTWFPVWNKQGIITGTSVKGYTPDSYINGKQKRFVDTNGNGGVTIYAPQSAGTAGDILVSTGNGAPVWSSVTMPDMSGFWNSAETKTYVDSAVTELQDQVDTMDEVVSAALVDLNERVDEISGNTGGGTDLSNYWNSAQTENAISVATQDMVTSTDIKHIVKCTQAQYDDPSFIRDPETLYIIVNSI